MREGNEWIIVFFGTFYTIIVLGLGAMHTIGGHDDSWVGGTDRIVNTPELLVISALPMLVLLIAYSVSYFKSKE